ncbi:hypothetical protein ASPCADRAFT_211436 [Aspergillus carbonarius ITEM 5010]|uniref:Uncharacterized protein n=1 Tax=Aspergillus carbonarius (strain ITEM 5010) TaxID=602072 RepID=A0A1R3R9J7_ASPC5|nr:hypothetical protein ASPCADRAFT_211436 [Aspergillus carbonarius ITEM 5010]
MGPWCHFWIVSCARWHPVLRTESVGQGSVPPLPRWLSNMSIVGPSGGGPNESRLPGMKVTSRYPSQYQSLDRC